MKTFQSCTLRLGLLLTFGIMVSHCQKKSTSPASEDTESSLSKEVIADAPSDAASTAVDYPKLYCQNLGKLKLRADISQEAAFFCKGDKPSADFLKFRSQALQQVNGNFELSLLQAEHDPESDQSEFLIAWSFHVPIRPFEVKARPIYQYVSQGFTTETLDLKSLAVPRDSDPLDSGLHLWSVDMNYELSIKGTQGLTLNSQRKTQYNLYQVQSGNEEMGFGLEHLVDLNNPHYKTSTMLNVSFNDGGGYNDGKGGTVVVTLLHFVLNNQGFPATATRSIQDIAKHIADGMYQGLKQ